MGELMKPEGSDLNKIIHGKGEDLTIPKPFERDIFLFDTHLAVTSFVEGSEELEPFVNIDDKLDFFREPDNPHDVRAIMIKNADGVKIGYVPRADNAIFSRLIDAGKLLFGKITYKEMMGKWLKIDIKVFLHE